MKKTLIFKNENGPDEILGEFVSHSDLYDKLRNFYMYVNLVYGDDIKTRDTIFALLKKEFPEFIYQELSVTFDEIKNDIKEKLCKHCHINPRYGNEDFCLDCIPRRKNK